MSAKKITNKNQTLNVPDLDLTKSQNKNASSIKNLLDVLKKNDNASEQSSLKGFAPQINWNIAFFDWLLPLYQSLLWAEELNILDSVVPKEYHSCLNQNTTSFNKICSVLFSILRKPLKKNKYSYSLITAFIYWATFLCQMQNLSEKHNFNIAKTSLTEAFFKKIKNKITKGFSLRLSHVLVQLSRDDSFFKSIIIPGHFDLWLEKLDDKTILNYNAQKNLNASVNSNMVRHINDLFHQIQTKQLTLGTKTPEGVLPSAINENILNNDNILGIANEKWHQLLGETFSLHFVVPISKKCKQFILNSVNKEVLFCEYLWHAQPFLSKIKPISILQHNIKNLFAEAFTVFNAYREWTLKILGNLTYGRVDLLIAMDYKNQLWAILVETKFESLGASIVSWCGQLANYIVSFKRWIQIPENRKQLYEELLVPMEGNIEVVGILLVKDFPQEVNSQPIDYQVISEDLSQTYALIPLAVATFSFEECDKIEDINFPSFLKSLNNAESNESSDPALSTSLNNDQESEQNKVS